MIKIEKRGKIMLTPISTNKARKMIEEALGVPKINLEAVKHYFICISGDESPGVTKYWEQKMDIK